jgi:hypothetical protein
MCRESVSDRLHFANDIRDSLALGLLVVVPLSRNLAHSRQGHGSFRPLADIQGACEVSVVGGCL